MSSFNDVSDISRTLKGYFSIISDEGYKYRYKLLQEITISTISDFEKFYSDSGEKILLSTGDSSTFSFRVKKTADLWDGYDVGSSINVYTIGNLQNKIINERVVPEVQFEGVYETDAASSRFIIIIFNGFITSIDDIRNPSLGATEIVISGEIKNITKSKREAEAPQIS